MLSTLRYRVFGSLYRASPELRIFRAGFALNTVGSFVNGLTPLRAFVAGFSITTNLASPGTKKAPVFLSSL
jgi:hypothetical protein